MLSLDLIPEPDTLRDLRAELESLPKPAGALMYNEPTVRKPDRLIGTHDGGAPFETTPGRPAIDPNDVLWHYITQINLRLTLNRVHSALYKSQGMLPFSCA